MKTGQADEKKAVVYLRVSTKEQDQFSLDAQLSRCNEYAEEHGLKIKKEFREAASGWKANARAEYFRMIEYIEAEKIPHLIFYLPDRIARNSDDWKPLRETGVRHHDAVKNDSFSPLDPKDYKKRREFERALINAAEDSDDTRERVTNAYADKVNKGHYPHSLPLGFCRVYDTVDGKLAKRIEIDPIRGPLIQQMFRLYATGTYTRKQIAAKMRDLGLRSWKGNTISVSQIEKRLKDIKYTGQQFRWKGQEPQDWNDNCPPLISKALFAEVQAVFEAKCRPRSRGGQDYNYKGLLLCGLCGSPYFEENHERRYFRCTYQRQACNKMDPPSPRLKGSELDLLLETAIDMLDFEPGVYEWIKDEVEETFRLNRETEAVEIKRLEKDKERAKEERANTLRAFNKGIGSEEDCREETRKLNEEIERIDRRLRELDTAEEVIIRNSLDTLGILKDFKNQYLSADPEKRRRMNFLLFRKIAVHPLKQSKKELLADPKRFLLLGEYPLEIEWKEPFSWLFEGKFTRELGRLADEAVTEDMMLRWMKKPTYPAENEIERA